ncbi:aspartate kinase [Macrococcus sp. FSL R5-0951]|uniref:aspartate kinase n=1 Tax=Macrococcoides caseolyticum TaxID=69966 RepID=UPI000C31E612|nr:aspartate kinase [Macrococcus caseolyticus]PKE64059.1 aspartate kinase [Macrococcus caseolyticus]PKF45600.1 aspartate kinase [Macrococcus caseolyticus]
MHNQLTQSNIRILKFGGTSVSDFDKISTVANYLKERTENNEKLVVVVSAMGKTTDDLMRNVSSISRTPKESALAMLLTTGEQQTISYLSIILHDLHVASIAMTGSQAGIRTKGHYLKSKITEINDQKLIENFKSYDVIIIAGFQGINEQDEITTLGRGGSDTTAVALAAALSAPCEIYTDVTGVFGTDPRIYPETRHIDELSFEEMMELSSLGAGVLETRSVEIAKNHNIPIYLGKTLSDEKGTWIMPKDQILEKKAVTGVALDNDMEYVTLSYPMNDTKLLNQLFDELEQEEVNIDMISQIVNLDGLQISFTMKDTDKLQIERIFNRLSTNYPAISHQSRSTYAKLSVIGSGMRDMSGVASKVFKSLIHNEIPFYQVTTSEISISYVIDKENGEHAVQSLCKVFNI